MRCRGRERRPISLRDCDKMSNDSRVTLVAHATPESDRSARVEQMSIEPYSVPKQGGVSCRRCFVVAAKVGCCCIVALSIIIVVAIVVKKHGHHHHDDDLEEDFDPCMRDGEQCGHGTCMKLPGVRMEQGNLIVPGCDEIDQSLCAMTNCTCIDGWSRDPTLPLAPCLVSQVLAGIQVLPVSPILALSMPLWLTHWVWEQIAPCKGGCGGHGVCCGEPGCTVNGTGTCKCTDGYWGINCEVHRHRQARQTHILFNFGIYTVSGLTLQSEFYHGLIKIPFEPECSVQEQHALLGNIGNGSLGRCGRASPTRGATRPPGISFTSSMGGSVHRTPWAKLWRPW
eukprot:COSAG02_NODE_3875_length_6104_cov_4.803331_7_plen_340_part_00